MYSQHLFPTALQNDQSEAPSMQDRQGVPAYDFTKNWICAKRGSKACMAFRITK